MIQLCPYNYYYIYLTIREAVWHDGCNVGCVVCYEQRIFNRTTLVLFNNNKRNEKMTSLKLDVLIEKYPFVANIPFSSIEELKDIEIDNSLDLNELLLDNIWNKDYYQEHRNGSEFVETELFCVANGKVIKLSKSETVAESIYDGYNPSTIKYLVIMKSTKEQGNPMVQEIVITPFIEGNYIEAINILRSRYQDSIK
jgi:hypothetical protein